ncbi:hypothetical protein F5X99DRAFT_428763 [Biscogniauxia marginata]|nr:hypothetical protein F5X99DRAFT_428763 [Biscogniauxia marginata]
MDPNNTPALEPPLGEESNFVDPYSLQPQRIAVATVALVVCTISVASRVYTRSLMKKFNIDDCGFTTFTVLLIVAGEYGDGTHQWNVTVADLKKNLLIENIAEIVYCVAMFTIKYVVLRQIESIFFNHQRNTLPSRAISVLIWANLFLFTSLAFAFIFACVPREKIWDRGIEGRCINSPASVTAGGSLNVVSDITILIIPIAAICKLQMPLKKKIRTAAVFAVGVFATIASILRLYYSLPLFYAEDITWIISPVGQWAIAELATGFLVACAPYFPWLFDHVLGRDNKAASKSSYSADSYGSKNQLSRIRVDRSWAQNRFADQGERGRGIFMTNDVKHSHTLGCV